MTDEIQLLIRAKQLDQDALAEIYDQFSPGIYRYAYRHLGEQSLAEDCVSETFSRFINALQRGKGPKTYLRAYLYRIAHNWITDQYRRKKFLDLPLEVDVPEPGEGPESFVVMSMEQAHVRRAIQQLTQYQRQVIMLKFIEGWDNEEIAQAMGRRVGAVKALQHRGLIALRKILILDTEDD